MALYDTLPVYKDVYALILLIYDVTKEFPREYKYTLGQDMKRDGLQLVRSIYRANKYQEKTEHLHQFQDDFPPRLVFLLPQKHAPCAVFSPRATAE